MANWQPSAVQDMLVARASLNQQIRSFFQALGVLEVETPLLAFSIGTDPALDPITAHFQDYPSAPKQLMYLQTSPEFAMKRLLAAGSGPIFQLTKAFRNGECGRIHNPEFSMLEWYRPGFSLEALMDEVQALVAMVLGEFTVERIAYGELFKCHLGLDPHDATLEELTALTLSKLDLTEQTLDHSTCLELLFSHLIEPKLQSAVMVYDYPQSQAALSLIAENAQGQKVARRFELIIKGMEIANGYDELCDSSDQRQRFSADQALRKMRKLPAVVEDELFLAALEAGLPACAGVALGVDRLLMLQCGADTISSVLAFAHANNAN